MSPDLPTIEDVQTTDSGMPGCAGADGLEQAHRLHQVDRERGLIVVVAATLAVGGRVRDQHVEAAERCDGPLDQRAHLLGIADVGGDGNEAIAGGELAAEVVEALLATGGDDDARTLGQEDAHDLAADPVAAAGDEHASVGESEIHQRSRLIFVSSPGAIVSPAARKPPSTYSDLPRHPARVPRQEAHGGGDVLGRAEAAERRAAELVRAHARVGQEVLGERRLDRPGTDGVDGDAVRGELDRHALREQRDRALRRAVDRLHGPGLHARRRGDVDDAAAAGGAHAARAPPGRTGRRRAR